MKKFETETTGPDRSKRKGILVNNDGFTLIEIMVVVIIMSLLVALVVPKFFGKVEQAKVKSTYAQIELLGTALDMYRLDVGKYPTTNEGLKALRERPVSASEWTGPYLKKELPNDAWRNPFSYTSPGKHGDYDLVSFGADGTRGGEEEDKDIVSWKGLQ